MLAVGGAWAVAGQVLPPGPAAFLEGPLTPHRIGLWQDALALARAEAALGVGPGRFGELSQAVAAAPPTYGKPHSAPLQQAAEQGAVGVLLPATVFCWMLHALWRTARPTPVALTAGAALTALAAISAVGNALSFTAVTAGAGLPRGAGHRPAVGRLRSVVHPSHLPPGTSTRARLPALGAAPPLRVGS
ncbi:hypothetical protein SGLAM104S_09390 [Streptomyces glaucescens]